MKPIDHLLTLCSAYCTARDLSHSRVSTIVFNDGKIIDRLFEGGNITVHRLESAVRWFSDNWPENAIWPETVARPSISHRSPVEAA